MQNVKIIFGAPGCGKTTRLLEVLEDVLKHYSPERVAFVSFTRKGTYEGRDRALYKFGYKIEDLRYFKTLHSIAFTEGLYSKYDLMSQKDFKDFSRAMGMHFNGYYSAELYGDDDKYLFMHDLRRNNASAAEQYMMSIDVRKLKSVEENYIEYKKYAHVADFTDIIERFIASENYLPLDVAIIDEAQDLTTLQWKMCEVAFRNCKEVYVAGDDDQAIYEWSGADIDYFLSLQGEREVLKKSYRLQRRVLDLAKRVSMNIHQRVDKDFNAMSDDGDVVFYNSLDEVEVDPRQTWYFLARNNWFLSCYRTMLQKRALVYMDKEVLSYDQRDIRCINNYEARRSGRVLTDLEETTLRKLLIERDFNGDLAWFEALNFDSDKTAYYRDLIRNKTDLHNRNLLVNTIHGVKGGEADNVVLLLDFTKAVKENFERNPDSELRCLYVACTRAKKHLHVVHSTTKNGYDSYIDLEAT